MTKLATILMIPGGPGFCKKHGIGPKVERWLLETFNCSLGNTGNVPWPTLGGVASYPNAKRIAPMFSYPESRKKWRGTEMLLKKSGLAYENSFYLYDCGDGDYLGTDEPGSRGDRAYRAFDWARGYQRVYDALVDYPDLKPVVTHPKMPQPQPYGVCRPFSDFGTAIVYAFDTHVIAMAEKEYGDYRDALDIPADAEVWAYNALYESDTNFIDPYRAGWMSEFTPTPQHNAGDMGPWLRERGISAWLQNANIKYLVNPQASGPGEMLSDNGAALLGSVANG